MKQDLNFDLEQERILAIDYFLRSTAHLLYISDPENVNRGCQTDKQLGDNLPGLSRNNLTTYICFRGCHK